jgi:hypothetical protein
MKHNPRIVEAFWKAHGIPAPLIEHKFAEHIKYKDKAGANRTRGWRFDYAWPLCSWTGGNPSCIKLALEVQGGCFAGGRHSRGGALRQEHHKLNTAAELGWRVIYCFPETLLTTATANLIKRCLGIA